MPEHTGVGECLEAARRREFTVRMGMSAADREKLSDLMPRLPVDVRDRVLDQLWLRAVLTEQRRRTRIAERDAFDERADRILEALDPAEGTFDSLVTVAQQILDRHYPADVPLVCDRESPDPGPRLAAALRDVLAVRAVRS